MQSTANTTRLLPDLPAEQLEGVEPTITSEQSDGDIHRLYIAHRTGDQTPNIYARTIQRNPDAKETITHYGAIDYSPLIPDDGDILEAIHNSNTDITDGTVQNIKQTISKMSRDIFTSEAEHYHFEDRFGAIHDNRLFIEHKDSFKFFLPDDAPEDAIHDLYEDWFTSQLNHVDTEDWHYDFGYAGTITFCDFRQRAAHLADTTLLTEQESLAQALAEYGLTLTAISRILDKSKSQVSRQLDNIHDSDTGKISKAHATIQEVNSVPAHGGNRGNFTTHYS